VNFTPSGTPTSISIAGNITVSGNMTIGSGASTTTFSDNGNLITGPGTGNGTLTLANTSVAAGNIYTATYNGAKAIPDFGTYNSSVVPTLMSTVNFNANNLSTQTIPELLTET